MLSQNLFDPEEAGFFKEAHAKTDKFGDSWAMTPTYKLGKRSGNKNIVLLSTGGFAPLHDGHIAMMEAAKIHMEKIGFNVIGGYISPGHDDYIVDVKRIPLYAPERLAIANKKLSSHPWLLVDPWEAIGCTCSVNYTAVIQHLESLLGIAVCYVVGSDNARFSLAFKDKGLICVVQRTSDVSPNPKWAGKSYSAVDNHVFFADNDPIPGSSTSVRKELNYNKYSNKGLILRLDNSSEPYIDKLLSILKEYYTRVSPVHVAYQGLPKGIDNMISLDQMITSAFGNLGVSRNYAEGGYYKLGYINRPGTPLLEQQVSVFSGKKVSLFDDDYCTGGTLMFAASLLKSVSCDTISHHSLYNSDNNIEIMDARDFLPVHEGGLVVQGKRVPYIYPYVCPHVRASIPSDKAEEFSDRIRSSFWE